MEMQIGLIPVIPLSFAVFIPLFVGRRKVVGVYSAVATLTTFLATVLMLYASFSSSYPLVYDFGGWKAPFGIIFEVDRLSSILAVSASFGFFIVSLYASSYLSRFRGMGYFHIFLLGLEVGVLGAFMTGDAFNLFVMLEAIGAAAYGIVGFYRSRGDSMEAAFKYGISGAMATSMYFLGLGFVYAQFGTLNMATLSADFHRLGTVSGLAIFFALTLSMVLVKSAVFPGHYWLPDAYQGAPIPAVALLSGFVEVVGIYVLARYEFTVFSSDALTSLIFLFLGTATAFLGSVMMLFQEDLKRLIAYSTILHMGYLMMALGVGSSLALEAIAFHIVNHAVAKMLLILTAGSFIYAAGSSKLKELDGIGRRMPGTTFMFGLATMSLVGVPPLNVFFSKMLIYDALIQKGPAFAFVVVITSIISAWAYIRVLVGLWRGKKVESRSLQYRKTFRAVNVVLSALVLVLGVLAPLLLTHVFGPAASQAVDWQAYVRAALGF